MIEVATHLTFQGDADAAVRLYATVFSEFQVLETEEYGGSDGMPAGALKLAKAKLGDHALVLFDSPIKHEWDFTPAVSLLVSFSNAADLQVAFALLSEGGEVFMPLDDYGFSKSFGWIADRFGVSWQLNLPS